MLEICYGASFVDDSDEHFVPSVHEDRFCVAQLVGFTGQRLFTLVKRGI